MNKIMKDRFLLDLIGLGERIRDLCAARFPKNIAHYTGSQLRMIKRIFELTRSDIARRSWASTRRSNAPR